MRSRFEETLPDGRFGYNALLAAQATQALADELAKHEPGRRTPRSATGKARPKAKAARAARKANRR